MLWPQCTMENLICLVQPDSKAGDHLHSVKTRCGEPKQSWFYLLSSFSAVLFQLGEGWCSKQTVATTANDELTVCAVWQTESAVAFRQ